MAMTEEEILREAARIRARRRRRIERTCAHCGATYEGLVHSRYCSDRCRVAASRNRHRQHQDHDQEDSPVAERIAPQGDTESVVDYFRRVGEVIAARGGMGADSTELIRQSRAERSAELMRASGLDSDEPTADA